MGISAKIAKHHFPTLFIRSKMDDVGCVHNASRFAERLSFAKCNKFFNLVIRIGFPYIIFYNFVSLLANYPKINK